jgi:hypothetical protein
MPRLIRGVARTAVIAGTATAVSNRVSRRQGERWNDQAEAEMYEQQQAAAAYQPPPPPAPPAGSSTDDKLAQLKELGQLKEAGVLTDIEFEVQKSKILNG